MIPIGVTTGTRSVSAAANESSNFKSTPYLFPNLDAPESVSDEIIMSLV